MRVCNIYIYICIHIYIYIYTHTYIYVRHNAIQSIKRMSIKNHLRLKKFMNFFGQKHFEGEFQTMQGWATTTERIRDGLQLGHLAWNDPHVTAVLPLLAPNRNHSTQGRVQKRLYFHSRPYRLCAAHGWQWQASRYAGFHGLLECAHAEAQTTPVL